MKKSRTLKMFSARAAMLMLAAMFSAGAWAQITIEQDWTGGGSTCKIKMHGSTDSDSYIGENTNVYAHANEYDREFKIGVPATVVFPFPTTSMTVTGGDFYKFNPKRSLEKISSKM